MPALTSRRFSSKPPWVVKCLSISAVRCFCTWDLDAHFPEDGALNRRIRTWSEEYEVDAPCLSRMSRGEVEPERITPTDNRESRGTRCPLLCWRSRSTRVSPPLKHLSIY